ncbi:MAG: hypothetical protein IJB27_05885 [Clostridia bacterium]|nr:hypothetical protein [Clostridia bacterium]
MKTARLLVLFCKGRLKKYGKMDKYGFFISAKIRQLYKNAEKALKLQQNRLTAHTFVV